MEIIKMIVILIIFIIAVMILNHQNNKKFPTNIRMLSIGVILLLFTIVVSMLCDSFSIDQFLSFFMSFASGTLIALSLKDLLQKENDLHLSGDWRKNLYLLEQKEIYTLSDLYVLNSYINPYSTKNKCSEVINSLIVCIMNNHIDQKNQKIDYTSLKEILINYLKNNEFKSLDKLPSTENKSIFSVSEDIDLSKKLDYEEYNLIKLACHVLLKHDWQKWTD